MGAPLASALLFIAITATFVPALVAAVPGFDGAAADRLGISPLAAPPPGTPPDLAAAIDAASTDAFHLAMLVAAALLVAGAVVNLLGLERRRPADDGAEPDDAESVTRPAEGRPPSRRRVRGQRGRAISTRGTSQWASRISKRRRSSARKASWSGYRRSAIAASECASIAAQSR